MNCPSPPSYYTDMQGKVKLFAPVLADLLNVDVRVLVLVLLPARPELRVRHRPRHHQYYHEYCRLHFSD